MRRSAVYVIPSAILAAVVGLTLAGCTEPHHAAVHSSVAAASSAAAAPSPEPTSTQAPWNTPKDSGPTTGATGVVRTDGSGTPVGYTVAAGDTQGAVCIRLGVRWWQLTGPDGAFLGTYPELQIGEQLSIVDVPESDALAAGESDNNALC